MSNLTHTYSMNMCAVIQRTHKFMIYLIALLTIINNIHLLFIFVRFGEMKLILTFYMKIKFRLKTFDSSISYICICCNFAEDESEEIMAEEEHWLTCNFLLRLLLSTLDCSQCSLIFTAHQFHITLKIYEIIHLDWGFFLPTKFVASTWTFNVHFSSHENLYVPAKD